MHSFATLLIPQKKLGSKAKASKSNRLLCNEHKMLRLESSMQKYIQREIEINFRKDIFMQIFIKHLNQPITGFSVITHRSNEQSEQ